MHISDIKKYIQCPKLYQLSLCDNSEYFSFYNIDCDLDESIAAKLKIDNYLSGKVGDSNEDTFALIEKSNWIFRARLSYHGLRVKVPYMYVKDGHCVIYFSSLAVSVNENDISNMSWTVKVCELNGLVVDAVYVLYLNENYQREEQLDNELLWNITDRLIKKDVSIIDECHNDPTDIDGLIESLLHFDDDYEEIPAVRSSKCTSKRGCKYYDVCFPLEKQLPPNSILTLVSSANKYKMYQSGIEFLKDADPNLIEGNRVQYAQISADKNGGLYADKLYLKKWMANNLNLPLSFIDFEWDLYPIPPYHHMRPLQVLPFQFSLHILDENGLTHHQFIGTGDCRKEMIEKIISLIPKQGNVVAYNATGAEKFRINELAEAYPEYSEQLYEINSRMSDMAIPFVNGFVYDTAMAGNFTLKAIEEMVDSENSYHNLEVGNGIEAVEIYRKMCLTKDIDTKEEYLNQLYKYCGLDTYSLYKVYQWLLKITA